MTLIPVSGETRGPRVLIVEDERVVATHVERSLADAGYTVIGIAASATEAATLVDEMHPDVALVDIRLRGKSEGFQIAERLRNERDVPVVYMTAHTDDDTLQRAAHTGAYGYVVKPFTIGEVKSALQVALFKHRLDQRMAERERWFSTTLRAIVDGVVACDADQRVTFLNEAAERMLGLSEAAARGKSTAELLRATQTGLPEVTQALLLRRPVRFSRETPLEGASGLILEGAVAPIIHGGRVLGAVLVLHDVSEQRRRDEQLALTDRLSSLGTLVASVAHEINNPLAYTLGNLTLALGDLAELRARLPDDESRELLERVLRGLGDAEQGAQRVATTVKELRAFGRMEERMQRAVDPRACVDWAIRLTGNQLLHQARLLTNLRDVPQVRANELKLSQVIVNLLTNAAQALTGEREENEVKVSTWTDEEGRAVIEVEDNGRGMSEAVKASIFEPFFTTKAAGHGTGLGLCICRSIVQGFGGEIMVESEPGKGSRFSVRLPPCSPESGASAAPVSERLESLRANLAPRGPRPRVLVVDDEAMIRALVAKLLDDRYEVIGADSVRGALAILNEGSELNVVLCDLMMPGESGIDLFAVLRRLYPDMVERVGFITGGAVTPDTAEFLENAARPVLSKPFELGSLRAFVERVLLEQSEAQTTPAAYRPVAPPSGTR